MERLKKSDLREIVSVGFELGRVVESARRYPMDVSKMNGLLRRMKPYREIFEDYVLGANVELNGLHPLPDNKPRFNYQIPK